VLLCPQNGENQLLTNGYYGEGGVILDSFVQTHEATIRLGFFFGVFALMAAWELRAPRRALTLARSQRWLGNLGLVALNTVLLRLVFPAAAVGMAAFASARGWGLLNAVDIPHLLAVTIAVVALDFVIWLQHVMFHAIPALWRLHRVHHADLDYDLTTGARFHPVEILLSMLVKFAAIAALGPPVLAVILFEVILNAMAMFNHANVCLPPRLDRILRWLVVTPDMHRVHHSVEDDETNSNFGFSLSWWDRLLGTYRDQPRAGHEGMIIGIRGFRDPRVVDRLPGMLALPFAGPVQGYAINRRHWEG
jgi:sterol desaturase/sphingolipid hydroxylase (fatty acid hydroxylase superfamily)